MGPIQAAPWWRGVGASRQQRKITQPLELQAPSAVRCAMRRALRDQGGRAAIRNALVWVWEAKPAGPPVLPSRQGNRLNS